MSRVEVRGGRGGETCRIVVIGFVLYVLLAFNFNRDQILCVFLVHNSCTRGLHGSVKKVILFAKLLDPLKWTFYQVFFVDF